MNAETIYQRLRSRYFIAFFVLAILSIFAYINLYYLIKSQYDYSEIINKSGKQRMLSQHIALLAHQWNGNDTQWHGQIGKKFSNAVTLFETDHDFLMHKEMNDYIHNLYSQRGLHENVQNYVRQARSFFDTPSELQAERLFLLSQELLPMLDEVVDEYQAIDETKADQLHLIETLILVSALLTLLLEAVFIFYPSLNELKKSVEKDKIIMENSKYLFLNEFFRSIAHQWRQPLTAISLLFDNIQDLFQFNELTNENLNELCKTGKEQIQKLDTTIRNVAQNRHDDMINRTFNTVTAVRHAIRVVQSHYGVQKADIAIEGDEFTINGDRNGFMQIVATVLSNSIDAIEKRKETEPEFKGRITVRSMAAHNGLNIRISDNGGGIDPKNIKRIFEPYFTTRFASHNKGMSLYVSKKILEENFAGTIEAYNEEDGAVIAIMIPVHV